MTALLLLVPAAPLAASLAVLLGGRRMPRGGGWLVVASLGLSTVALALLAGAWREPLVVAATWMPVSSLRLEASLALDGLGWWTASLVAVVSLLVTLYGVGYMREDRDRRRFFVLMALFAGAMLTLVLAGSTVLLYGAWEAVGFASFGLIGFWHEDAAPRRASAKAFLMTRFADLGMLAGWLLLLVEAGTTNLAALNRAAASGVVASPVLTAAALLLAAGAVGKSAQLPLTAWLPDAMAGPTPVSALLHSATMVAAGVYLLLRLFPLYQAAPHALTAILWVGAATALVAALTATAQQDLKRILAWSTVAQLGEMMMALGLAAPLAAAFHLTTHAVFKSALFLVAGVVDHCAGSRRLGELGGLARRLPLMAVLFAVAAAALVGLPPLAGYFSGERIMAAARARGAGWSGLVVTLLFLAGVYIGRAAWAVFGRWPGAPTPPAGRPPAVMTAPAVMLGVLAVAGGLLGGPLERVLPFDGTGGHAGAWGWAAVAAAVAGAAVGVLRVRATGPAPALGGAPARLDDAVELVPAAAARLATPASSAVVPLERAADMSVRALAGMAIRGSTAVRAGEAALDGAARAVAGGAAAAGRLVRLAERRGFGAAADGTARLLGSWGERLRRLETGVIFHYTTALFGWVLAAAVLVIALIGLG